MYPLPSHCLTRLLEDAWMIIEKQRIAFNFQDFGAVDHVIRII